MSSITALLNIIKKIDRILDDYNSGDLKPETVVKDIFLHRSKQNKNIEKAIAMASNGLVKFPFNTELLRRRAFLKSLTVTPKMEYPDLKGAEKDLRDVLKIDPNNIFVATDLLELMFHFSSMPDAKVAEVACEFAKRTERLLESIIALEIKALSYADKVPQAKKRYDKWIKIFLEFKRPEKREGRH